MKETVLPNLQVYVLAIGTLVPLASYVLNHFAPWADERVKGIVQVVVAAVAAALYQALAAGNLGLNGATLELVLTAIIGALGAHKLLWSPSGISTSLGGGSDAADSA